MIIARAPLRISFAGGGTDLPAALAVLGEGRVVSATLAASVYVVVKSRFEGDVRLSYSKTEIVPTVEQLEHALIRNCCHAAGVTQGIEIVTLADVPGRGTGLGSSGALAVATLAALNAYTRQPVDTDRLAMASAALETAHGGGVQDAYAAAYGGVRRYAFRPNEWALAQPLAVDLAALERHLLLVQIGDGRDAGKVLKAQQQAISEGQHTKRLAMMREQADYAARYLERGEWKALGHLLLAGWDLKRDLPGADNGAVNTAIQLAMEYGAYGGKLCGAGGGGFLLLIAPPDRHEAIKQAVPGRYLDATLTSEGARIVYGA